MPVDPRSLFWAVATIGLYLLSRAVHRRHPRWWTAPLLLTLAMCFTLAAALHASYGEYLGGTRWLLAMLGPATVAFALPIYRHLLMRLRHWPVMLAGVGTGAAIAFASSWALARLFGLSADLQLSLLPRSVTTPFALEFVHMVGGIPELTAASVVITGLLGAFLGEVLLVSLPIRSAMARGTLFGMGAHAIGTAKARQVGAIEGSVAGLTMVLAGLLSVLVAPLLALLVS